MAYVRADHVWKRFRLQKDRADSVGQLLVRMVPGFRRVPPEPFWALRDVSFEMRPGRSLGIIGHNGAGKSTLLKLLTRTLVPTAGSLTVKGRVSALIELGAGFHPDFTGRENVILNASILGIGRREVERRMEDIIEFAGIRRFMDSPVKYYSSGMHARLGFSVAIHVEPELLIVDEVLAVGDAAFQQQCMERIYRMKREGVSILLVTHDLSAIERLMDDAVWLDHGQVRLSGAPHHVVDAYRRSTELPPATASSAADCQSAAEAPRIDRVTVASHPGRHLGLACGRRFEIDIANPLAELFRGYLSASLSRPDGLVLAEFSALDDNTGLSIAGHGQVTQTLVVDQALLAPGSYDFDAVLMNAEGRRVASAPERVTFQVVGRGGSGIMALPHAWEPPASSKDRAQ